MHDPHTYDVVSRDIVQRWTFPIVPDANLLPDCNYTLGRFGVYKEGAVSLARSCELLRNCVVGAGTTVGNASTVRESEVASVVGRVTYVTNVACVTGERERGGPRLQDWRGREHQRLLPLGWRHD